MASFSELLENRRVQYALIGGLCVAFRGNKRATEDIDFLINVPSLELPGLLEAMSKAGCRLDLMKSIRQWNSDGILVLQWPGGVQIDLLKPVVPVFLRILDRAKTEKFGNQTLKVADAEGLILMKLIAFRPLDHEDIKGILLANGHQLELDWIRSEAKLAGLDNQRLAAFDQLVKETTMN